MPRHTRKTTPQKPKENSTQQTQGSQSQNQSSSAAQAAPDEPRRATSRDGKRESDYALFHFPNDADKIPEDFFTDPQTGIRPGEKTKPSGVTKTFIDKGFGTYTTLPPLEVWEKGVWFIQLDDDQSAAVASVVGKETWEAWIVSGEGTPGNFLMRIYVVPESVAAEVEPDHPLLWPERLRKLTPHTGVVSSYTGSMYGGGSGWHYQSNQQLTTTPKVTQAPALPAGIRFRCAGCGHWFKQDGLAAHATNCCPGKEASKESDWALLCECCSTLDQVAACKPGFPRPKKEVSEEEKTEVKESKTEATAEVVQ